MLVAFYGYYILDDAYSLLIKIGIFELNKDGNMFVVYKVLYVSLYRLIIELQAVTSSNNLGLTIMVDHSCH
jgi:hypothetical protein